jgi:dTMP kinase
MYFAIEGLDNSGKSWLAQELYIEFINRGYNVVLVAEPYSCPLTKAIKVIKNKNYKYEDQILSRVFAADRLILKETIENAEESGVDIIISDRSLFSSLAYQGDNIDVYKVNTEMRRPDFVVYLDIEPEDSMMRGIDVDDKFETVEFLVKAKQNYEQIRKSEQDWHVIDATQTKKEVFKQAVDAVLFQLEDRI